ncbi:MAG: hypothetical protein NVS1B4_24020 [Gemmatimonadaceae bacterium]
MTLAALHHPAPLPAQQLDSLVAQALAASPIVRAAAYRARAAHARVGPAGARPDPMLGVGILDLPIARPGFDDSFTMKVLRVSQTFPYPGKTTLRERTAEHEASAADALVRDLRFQVEYTVKDAYFEIVGLDRALDVVARSRSLVNEIARAAERRYGVAAAEQQDALRARVDAARLNEQGAILGEQRRAALARLAAAVDATTDTMLAGAVFPDRILRAVVPDSTRPARFVSTALDARVADSPLRPLADVQLMALHASPMLREHEERIEARRSALDGARKEHLPDFDVALEYDQRHGYPDFVTAMVSIPLRLQRRRKQDQGVVEAEAELAAAQAEHRSQQNALAADVARRYADLERSRSQIALYVTAIIPAGRAALATATASYGVGRTDVLSVLNNTALLLTYERDYYAALTDFARNLAAIERMVGAEVLR